MTEREQEGVFRSLLFSAGLATVVFAGMVLFSPERRAGRVATPVPHAAEFETLGDLEDASPTPAPPEDDEGSGQRRQRSTTNRNERARDMFRWSR